MTIYNLKIYNDDTIEIDELYTSKIKAKNRVKELERKYFFEPIPKEDIEINLIKVK